jgi:type IV pilus assembly protein PilV
MRNFEVYQPLGETGFVLVEALVAILVFSIGILGIIALQAVSVTNSSESMYRRNASLLADQLIGKMWVDDRSNLQVNYQGGNGTDGAKYTVWQGYVNSQLPMDANTPPTVVVTPLSFTPARSLVTITISWKLPDGAIHTYVATTEISQFNQ